MYTSENISDIIYTKYEMSKEQSKRYEILAREYLDMHDNPDNCIPKFVMPVISTFSPVWEDMLSSKEIMLRSHLERSYAHIIAGDDFIPGARVDFGTAIVANAFGCNMFYPVNNLPCAKDHVVTKREDIYKLKVPPVDCEIYEKVRMWTEYFKQNLPEGYRLAMADIQGPFNNAHLVRGTDIFYDMYDDEHAFETLMSVVTDATVMYAKEQRKWIDAKDNIQYDWSALWRGNARISNCSLHMLGDELYRKYVLKHDEYFAKSMKGARMHYCGSTRDVIKTMSEIPGITAIDYDSALHDVEKIMDVCPPNIVLLQSVSLDSDFVKRIFESKKWPYKKRNVILSLRGRMDTKTASETYIKFRRMAEN